MDYRTDLYYQREDFIDSQIKKYPDLNTNIKPAHRVYDFNEYGGIAWDVYKTDSLTRDWGWELHNDYFLSKSVGSRIAKILTPISCFKSRHDIFNPICITLTDSLYWIHPGHHRYFLHKVVTDFDLPAIIIDTDRTNTYRIKSDFGNVYPYERMLKFGTRHVGNMHSVFVVGDRTPDITYYEEEWKDVQAIFNAPYALDIYMKDEHYLTVPNGKPKKSYRVENILGVTQLSIKHFADPDYEFEELYYESI